MGMKWVNLDAKDEVSISCVKYKDIVKEGKEVETAQVDEKKYLFLI